MSTIVNVRNIVKEKLTEFKVNEGCTSYSDAINLLLEREKNRKEKEVISK